MAGSSKVPGGSLRAHASNTSKAKSANTLGYVKPTGPKINPKTVVGDDSDSDSSSSSDSDSTSDDVAAESSADFRKRLSQQTPSSQNKTKGAKPKESFSAFKTSTPAKSPTVNGLAASVEKRLSEKKLKKEASSSSSEDSTDSEEDESSSDEKTEKLGAKGKQVKKSESDSESSSEDETSSSSESESDEADKSAPPKTSLPPAKKTKAAVKKESTPEPESSSAESDSEDEDEDTEDSAQQIEKQIRNDVKTAKSQSSSKAPAPASPEKSSRKKAKSAEPQAEDEDGDVEMMDQSMALTNGGNPTHVGDVPEFVAPDFHLRKLDGLVNASDVASFFSRAQMEGKQVWYITAPASLPVTVVQDLTIPMDKAQKGLPVLSHNGDDYRMAFDNPDASSSFRLLIPNKQGEEYSSLGRPVQQTMHFTRSETFPPGGPASVTTTQTVATTKPARPQPEGLRARYTPLGVPAPKPTIATPAPSTKKKAQAKVAAQGPGTPSTSSKKKRKHRDDGEDGPAVTASSTTTPSVLKDDFSATGKKNNPAEKSTKKQKRSNDTTTTRKITPVPVPALHNGQSSSIPSASQPVARSRSSLSPGAALPATQIPTSRQTPVPIPTFMLSTGAGQSGLATPSVQATKEGQNERKKQEKDKKKAEKAAAKAAAKAAKSPKKVTQVLPPQFDSRGRPIH